MKNLILTQIPCFNSQTPESPPAAKKNAKASKESRPGQQKATKENCKQKEKPKGRVCTNKCSYKTYFRDSSCYVSFRLWLVSLHVRNSLCLLHPTSGSLGINSRKLLSIKLLFWEKYRPKTSCTYRLLVVNSVSSGSKLGL